MKARWWLLAALCCGILIGPWLAALPGFVMIGTAHTVVEVRLSMAVAIGVVALMLTLMIGASAGFLTSIDKQVRRFARSERLQRSRDQTASGLRALAEGRWSDAEQILLKASKAGDGKLINFLGAAMAAQEVHALERRDRYLQQAQFAEPEAELAIGMMEARLHLRNGHYEHALLILLELDRLHPRHAPALKLLQHVYRRLKDMDALERLLPRLQKLEVLPPARLIKLQGDILRQRLQGRGHSVEILRQLWRQADKPLRSDTGLFGVYIRALCAAGASVEAERLTRKFIAQFWNRDLMALYGEIPGRDALAQLQTAEEWLQKREPDVTMLLTLGRLSMRAQQWLKAQRYLEQLIAIAPSAEVWLLLADVYERLQEPGQMIACLRQALKTATA